jgi:hypothetical protein
VERKCPCCYEERRSGDAVCCLLLAVYCLPLPVYCLPLPLYCEEKRRRGRAQAEAGRRGLR